VGRGRGGALYVMVAVLVGGTIWRYRYDKFDWTTRSSELYESRLLRIGSPLFHFGLLVVIIGHVIGLIIPRAGPTPPGSASRPTTCGRCCWAASPGCPRWSGSAS
jgi:Nitrate reductase gamma subunit